MKKTRFLIIIALLLTLSACVDIVIKDTSETPEIKTSQPPEESITSSQTVNDSPEITDGVEFAAEPPDHVPTDASNGVSDMSAEGLTGIWNSAGQMVGGRRGNRSPLNT